MSKEAAGEIELNINVTETQFSCYNQQFTGFIKSFNNYNIEAVQKFAYLGSNTSWAKLT